jgi:hypothetical protein
LSINDKSLRLKDHYRHPVQCSPWQMGPPAFQRAPFDCERTILALSTSWTGANVLSLRHSIYLTFCNVKYRTFNGFE